MSADAASIARSQIRGSSLLLTGRGIALALKLVSQMLVVRYLSTSDYGAWAYALAVVALLRGFSSLSLDRVVTRFLAIYHQRGEHDRFFGTLALMVGTILLTGTVFAGAVYVFPSLVARMAGGEALPLSILLVLVFLVPLEALDQLLLALLATFGRAGSIFLRRHLLAPVLQLVAVALLIASGSGVVFLAWGYVAGTLFGVLLYGVLVARMLREQGMFAALRQSRVRVPFRELVSFAVPLMTSDWLAALVQTSGVVLLGYYHATEQVAAFRVVVPLAVLNEVVIQSFTLLYVPVASRMFAARDPGGIADLYWRTAAWIAVLTFPVFALTFAASTPLTVLLFGERYVSSGPILAALAVGYYAQAALGFNGSTLKVVGRLRALVAVNLIALAVNAALALLLVPRWGPMGAAGACAGTLVIHNALKQAALHRVAGIRLADARYLAAYGVIAGGVGALVLLRVAYAAHPVLLFAGAAAVSGAVLVLTRGVLRIGEVFPELHRVRVLRPLLT